MHFENVALQLPMEFAKGLAEWPLGEGHDELQRRLVELQRHEYVRIGATMTDAQFEAAFQKQYVSERVDLYRELWGREPSPEQIARTPKDE